MTPPACITTGRDTTALRSRRSYRRTRSVSGVGIRIFYEYTFDSPTNLQDPSGHIVALPVVGGVLGAGAQAYSDFGAYQNGAINGEQFAEAIAFGGLTGALSAIPSGLISGAIIGGLAAFDNTLFNQQLRGCSDVGAALRGAAFGAAAGFTSSLGGAIGEQIVSSPDTIGAEVLEPEFQSGYPISARTLATAGGIIGDIIGTIAGSYLDHR
jgi:hypothetical protein